MSKLYRQPVEAQVKEGLPVAFRWRGQWYSVVECTVQGYLPRYRCETRQGMLCDLVEKEDGWMLERVWD